MRTTLTVGLMTLILTGVLGAEDAPQLLQQIDSQRSIPDMNFELSITAYQGEKKLDENTLWGRVKSTSEGNKTLVAFTAPASVKGRKMLMDNPTVYLLFPKTRNPIRLSPLQVLLGQSSNGDVARTSFSQEYEPKSLDSASLDGVACWFFELGAKSGYQSSTYHEVRLWVEKTTLRPLAADFFGSSGTLLKHTVYGDWRSVGLKSLPFRLEIFDGNDPSKHTVMQYLRVGRQALPLSAFSRNYLEGWSPEVPE